MKAYYCEQKKGEWFRLRTGRITASNVSAVLAKLKDNKDGSPNAKEAAERRNYRLDLIAERLTGQCEDNVPPSREMEWGIKEEDSARRAYELSRGMMAEPIGFVIHPRFDYAGASPDALIGNDGLLEIKCPKTTTHWQYIKGKVAPEDYVPQMQWAMACTDRKWCDFVSYDSRMPEPKQLFVVRVLRDDRAIAEMEAKVERFNTEIEDAILEEELLSLPFYNGKPEQTADEMLDQLMEDFAGDLVP